MCPICDNSNNKLIKHSFLRHFYYCQACSGHFLKEKFSPDYSEKYFQEKSNPSVISRLFKPILDFLCYLRVSKIRKLMSDTPRPNILDYGAGSGRLVAALRTINIGAVGFELSHSALELARAKNIPIYDEIDPKKYDLIMFWHSLEHINNPLETIRKIKNYLQPDGKILIAVPNAASFEARIFKTKWFHYTYPLHRIHFTPQSIKIMLEKAGLKTIQKDFFNPEYTISGLIQSFLNIFLPENILYSAISHRRMTLGLSRTIILAIVSILLLLFFSPLIIILFLVELIFKKTGAMIITVKNKNS